MIDQGEGCDQLLTGKATEHEQRQPGQATSLLTSTSVAHTRVWRRCRSVFYLPKPRPLDHLVGTLFGKPTLVLNGALDPLQKAVDRAEVRLSGHDCADH